VKPAPRTELPAEVTRSRVRERYGKIADAGGCCSSATSGGCGAGGGGQCCDGSGSSSQLGYSAQDLATLPTGADLGLGCGNPTAIAELRAGEIVLDLGSGAGIDCFLAARRVGPRGRVIGVDMTPEMLGKARENARNGRYRTVEFRLGEIEHLPVADQSVDVVLSNCVINLAPDKDPVYREAFRVLRPGGRLAISDVVATRPITPEDRADPALWSSCSSGALEVPDLKRRLRRAGFRRIEVGLADPALSLESLAGQRSLGVVSADIRAIRPTA
jgi:arsenite methyltransferase